LSAGDINICHRRAMRRYPKRRGAPGSLRERRARHQVAEVRATEARHVTIADVDQEASESHLRLALRDRDQFVHEFGLELQPWIGGDHLRERAWRNLVGAEAGHVEADS